MKDTAFEEEVWDKKKIYFGIIIAIVLIITAIVIKIWYLDSLGEKQIQAGEVRGVTASNMSPTITPFSQLKQIPMLIQKQIDTIGKQVTSLNAEEIASSSPQMKKLIDDLKILQQLPRNEAKQLCENFCRSF